MVLREQSYGNNAVDSSRYVSAFKKNLSTELHSIVHQKILILPFPSLQTYFEFLTSFLSSLFFPLSFIWFSHPYHSVFSFQLYKTLQKFIR